MKNGQNMKNRIWVLLAAGMVLAACEREQGAGFTGIGTSKASVPGYSLDFDGLRPASAE